MENHKLVDQKAERRYQKVRELIAAHPEIFARQGTVVATWRSYGGRSYGPYFAMTYWESGRQRWVYLGKSDELAERVRELLRKLQVPFRQRRALARLRAAALAGLRDCRAQWNRELEKIGLHLKGYEVRGWRAAAPDPL